MKLWIANIAPGTTDDEIKALVTNCGTMIAMRYHGASTVIPTYSVMGPGKVALEGCSRYLAHELGASAPACMRSRPVRSRRAPRPV